MHSFRSLRTETRVDFSFSFGHGGLSVMAMDRIAGIEIEYGCLVRSGGVSQLADSWPARVKDFLFQKQGRGLIDSHFRDYEEPPGNGGFLYNGGRLYLDMGHLEYATPECLGLGDLVAYEIAGDQLILEALEGLGGNGEVSFLKNNIDHFTGATFGCHENYLMQRGAKFTESSLGALLAFLATRQIFTGAGRIGSAEPSIYDQMERPPFSPRGFQMSQRADHMVNDIYQWVQFNRSIINARDEPLADPRKYRRLHLLIGDSNMSPYAMALKAGTTALILALLEAEKLPVDLSLRDAVTTTRSLSQDAEGLWLVELENGQSISAVDLQIRLLQAAREVFARRDPETDWVLENWEYVLLNLQNHPEALLGGVDWLTKRWLLTLFAEAEGLAFDDPWMLSQDLEYHNVNPESGLFFSVEAAGEIGRFNAAARRATASSQPPGNTRAAGRSAAMHTIFQQKNKYILNWDSIVTDQERGLHMSDPFLTYTEEVARFFAA